MTESPRQTRIDLSPEAREVAIDSLNDCLANTIYAHLAAKYAHWNVKGTGFYPAHLLFDKIAEFYNDSVDTLAERVTALGGTADGLLSDVAGASTIEYIADALDDVEEHTKAMADMLGQIANSYRQGVEIVRVVDVNDQLTQDIFIELGREADKLLYFLEASLRKL